MSAIKSTFQIAPNCYSATSGCQAGASYSQTKARVVIVIQVLPLQMILPVLLLVLLLLPVLVLHDFSAAGLYCTHTAVSGDVSAWGVTLFVNTTSLNLFSVLAKYSCTSILQIIYASHWLYILYPHLDCDCVSPLASSRGRVAVTCVKSTIQARVLGARRQGHPWVAHRGRDFALWNTFETMKPGRLKDTPVRVGHRGRQPHSLKLSGNYEAKTSQGHASHWAEASSSEKFRGPCIPFSWHAIFQEKLFLLQNCRTRFFLELLYAITFFGM